MHILESQTNKKHLEIIVTLRVNGDDWDCERYYLF